MESNNKKSVIKNSSKNTKNDVMDKNITKDKGEYKFIERKILY